MVLRRRRLLHIHVTFTCCVVQQDVLEGCHVKRIDGVRVDDQDVLALSYSLGTAYEEFGYRLPGTGIHKL